jgi:CelD/BcsL family acetyltransferase involved in cellulose biosynthesis
MVRIDQITREAQIKDLAPQWRALWRRTPNATPFQSPEWLLPWWARFGNSAPLLIAAFDNDQLIGLLPLYLFKEAGCRKLLPIGISLSDYLDALVDPDYPGLADGLLATLVAVPGWDICHLPDLPPGAALRGAVCPSELSEESNANVTCPVLALPGSKEALGEIIPGKTRLYLRQARHRAAALGAISVSRATGDTVGIFMDELFRLHEARWHRLAGRGVCDDPAVRRFHSKAAKRLSETGMLRLYLLRIADSPIAAYYGFTVRGAAYAYLTGFDPDRSRLRPGAQIMGHAIEEAISEGAREFHFLRGDEAYKYTWGAVDRPNTARTLRRRC